MNKTVLLWLALMLFGQVTYSQESDVGDINNLLDDFHHAAAVGDKTRYLNYFAQDGVFMGTDDSERWPLKQFSAYVDKRFVAGKGWEYHSEKRHISFSEDRNTAWFDEIMVSEQWGRFRGTGVVIRQQAEWKVAVYSLTLLVPNEAWEQITKVATEAFVERSSKDMESTNETAETR